MSEIDANFVVQAYNEKMYSMMTELIAKDAMIKQMQKEMQNLMEAIRSQAPNKKTENKKENI
jgi:hypothetical protein